MESGGQENMHLLLLQRLQLHDHFGVGFLPVTVRDCTTRAFDCEDAFLLA